MNPIVTKTEVHKLMTDILEQTGLTLEQLWRIVLVLSELYPKEWAPPKDK